MLYVLACGFACVLFVVLFYCGCFGFVCWGLFNCWFVLGGWWFAALFISLVFMFDSYYFVYVFWLIFVVYAWVVVTFSCGVSLFVCLGCLLVVGCFYLCCCLAVGCWWLCLLLLFVG